MWETGKKLFRPMNSYGYCQFKIQIKLLGYRNSVSVSVMFSKLQFISVRFRFTELGPDNRNLFGFSSDLDLVL